MLNCSVPSRNTPQRGDHFSYHTAMHDSIAPLMLLRARAHLQVGALYLDHLIIQRKYAQAASLCPRLLQSNVAAWER